MGNEDVLERRAASVVARMKSGLPWGAFQEEIIHVMFDLVSVVRGLRERAERAERVLLKALRRRAHVIEGEQTFVSIQSEDFRFQKVIECDGTDASIYRALVEACEGGESNG